MINKHIISQIFTGYGLCFRWYLHEGWYYPAAKNLYQQMDWLQRVHMRFVMRLL